MGRKVNGAGQTWVLNKGCLTQLGGELRTLRLVEKTLQPRNKNINLRDIMV